jgi:hypothetical protein
LLNVEVISMKNHNIRCLTRTRTDVQDANAANCLPAQGCSLGTFLPMESLLSFQRLDAEDCAAGLTGKKNLD